MQALAYLDLQLAQTLFLQGCLYDYQRRITLTKGGEGEEKGGGGGGGRRKGEEKGGILD